MDEQQQDSDTIELRNLGFGEIIQHDRLGGVPAEPGSVLMTITRKGGGRATLVIAPEDADVLARHLRGAARDGRRQQRREKRSLKKLLNDITAAQ